MLKQFKIIYKHLWKFNEKENVYVSNPGESQ